MVERDMVLGCGTKRGRHDVGHMRRSDRNRRAVPASSYASKGALIVSLLALATDVSAFMPVASSARALRRDERLSALSSMLPTADRLHRRAHAARDASGTDRSHQPRSRSNRATTAPGAGVGLAMEAESGGGAAHTIDTNDKGVSVLKVNVGGRELSFETGKVGRQASGAVMAADGDTVVYSTCCTEKKSAKTDFAPLRVDYMERFSAAGMTSGGYNKRDGRASDKETLVSRLMDRPLRPAMHPGWFHETQLLSWVLSYDTVHPPVPLAITAASAALALSNVPLVRAIAGVTVGMDGEGALVVNPEMGVAAMSPLNLTIAGTAEGVLMIEGESDFVGEEDMMRAIEVGHAAVKDLCIGIEAWSEVAGKEKRTDTLRHAPEGINEAMKDQFQDKVDDALFASTEGKGDQSAAMSEVSREVKEALTLEDEEVPVEGRYSENDVGMALKKLYSTRLRQLVKERGIRCDGRKTDEVRPISIETSLLPRTHGSCLFTRGDTQAIATVTLGGSGSTQKMDGITGTIMKNFYLQYTFPPSCVGETGRVGAPGRREVGHGALAEKALSYTVPRAREFPYTIRVESLITESCGSSSMASVCGGSLAMMDAGIPVTSPIAGVAMGLLLDEDGGSGDEAVVLTDILGVEDALGTMDFKVAGNAEGITTFQLDIKCAGLTTALLGRALTQAKAGRLHILSEMNKALPDGARDSISELVPGATVWSVEPDQIGKIIGPGGKMIKQIIEDYELDALDVQDDGRVFISSFNSTSADSAKKYIEEMLRDVSARRGAPLGGKGPPRGLPAGFNVTEIIGNTYRDCSVKTVHAFGAFVEFSPGIEGLVHVSELDIGRVVTAEGFLVDKPTMDVKVIGLSDKGKPRLSRRAVLMDDRTQGKDGDGPGAGHSPPRPGTNGDRPRAAGARADSDGSTLGVVKRVADSSSSTEANTPPVVALAEGPAAGDSSSDTPKSGG